MPAGHLSSAAPLALITGGHRRLGAHIAAALARAGYRIAIHGSHDAEPEAALAQALAGSGQDWHGFVADFSDPSSAERLLAEVIAHFGAVPDLLVNSASLFGQDRLADVGADDLSRHFAINASAPALLTKAFAAAIPVNGEGRDRSIINILDQRLNHPHGDQFAYTLSKYALAGLTRTAAHVLAPHIRVNAVAPGLTLVTADYAQDQTERLADAMPLARLPRPEEVAEAVLYLASARATTGQVIHVDGGAHMVSFPGDFMHLK
ncbi:MAG TPA: SDR family oxidoreductase [Sphingobium sp.]|uniref:SDR family oxidoreductase n=1 Tax=Sphingobium sp. TaxID=1912891 RepID=UPI002ED087F7